MLRARGVVMVAVLAGSAGCGESDPEEVEVRYEALNEEDQCLEVVHVRRPAEYWVYGGDQGCMDFSLPVVDPEGRCVFVADDCGPELTFHGDPYFSSCDTLPGCCEHDWAQSQCE